MPSFPTLLLTLILLLAHPVHSKNVFNLTNPFPFTFTSTPDETSACGRPSSQSGLRDISPEFHANVRGCQTLADRAQYKHGYWRTSYWGPEAGDLVTIMETDGCQFSIRRRNLHSVTDFKIGNEDIKNIARAALIVTSPDGRKAAASGVMPCRAVDESLPDEMIEYYLWHVKRPNEGHESSAGVRQTTYDLCGWAGIMNAVIMILFIAV